MAVEIERKFLVDIDALQPVLSTHTPAFIQQGYLNANAARTVRIRTVQHMTTLESMEYTGFITVKGITVGISRPEYEYEIPGSDAREMLRMCEHVIKKRRYSVTLEGWVWEIDVFDNPELSNLIIAEIELPSENATFNLPSWASIEVTDLPQYANSNLSKRVL